MELNTTQYYLNTYNTETLILLPSYVMIILSFVTSLLFMLCDKNNPKYIYYIITLLPNFIELLTYIFIIKNINEYIKDININIEDTKIKNIILFSYYFSYSLVFIYNFIFLITTHLSILITSKYKNIKKTIIKYIYTCIQHIFNLFLFFLLYTTFHCIKNENKYYTENILNKSNNINFLLNSMYLIIGFNFIINQLLILGLNIHYIDENIDENINDRISENISDNVSENVNNNNNSINNNYYNKNDYNVENNISLLEEPLFLENINEFGEYNEEYNEDYDINNELINIINKNNNCCNNYCKKCCKKFCKNYKSILIILFGTILGFVELYIVLSLSIIYIIELLFRIKDTPFLFYNVINNFITILIGCDILILYLTNLFFKKCKILIKIKNYFLIMICTILCILKLILLSINYTWFSFSININGKNFNTCLNVSISDYISFDKF